MAAASLIAVGGPDHARERVAVGCVDDRRARLVKVRHVEAHGLQGPARRAVAARKAAPDVLVRVDEQLQAVLAGLDRDRTHVVEVLLVVQAGPRVLDRLPGHQEAQEGEAPAAQPPEVLVCLCKRKGPAHEGDGAVVEEALGQVRGAVRPGRNLAAAAQVHPAQHQRAAVRVLEVGFVDVNHGCLALSRGAMGCRGARNVGAIQMLAWRGGAGKAGSRGT